MDSAVVASYIVLWIVVVALSVLVLAQSRLLGLLHQRIGPGVARAVGDGAPIGTRLAEIAATTIFGVPWRHAFPSPQETIVVFVSPQCSACTELIPHARDFAGHFGKRATLILVSVLSDAAMNRAFVDYARVGDVPYVIGETLATQLQVTGTPYAFKLDREGVVLAKGIVNHFEHLVSVWHVNRETTGLSDGQVDSVSKDVMA